MATFWLLFLYLIPKAIILAQDVVDLGDLSVPTERTVAAVIFAVGFLAWLWAGLSLAVVGQGTPLPFDAPRRMVVTGPYRWLRNPMVVGVLVQGLAEVIYSGAALLILYFGFLATCWTIFVRPGDERECQRVFGRAFEAHYRSVRLWLPMRRPWSPPPSERPPISLNDLPENYGRRRR
ncbi:MAG TPA: methyltransferase [Gemmatimonadales bacterium]|jgi:protein-S-isoprenylcysteine O-methyltransferase Ste14|nr:methyltransferase [Gemmatimonadales bacterium]